ncbi:MAG: tRNA uridine-5-carboxymethylaminomethyl(34) synthesis GTPase MnmE [Sphingobacteriales bacterium]|nr:MAG: tRNA uridine-5-carboxymethylaminomethyl(34) synthesis GTPase MnmE [Sphingobacteriales bacterium]
MNFQFITDTIAALATPPGVGALGIIRISGPDALSIADAVFRGRTRLAEAPGYTVHFGAIVSEDSGVLDEVLATVFRNPRSFTGEDSVEFSAHGSPFVLSQILQLLLAKGARLAEAGEFSQRAFLNGKMDLAQTEAVADLIHAESAIQQRAALHQMRGGFSTELNDLREQLIRLTALLELELDFSDEDVEFADRTALQQLITDLFRKGQSLTESFRLGNVIKNGVRVAIIGKPNAGKSTLLNALLQEDRAIVSEEAGTTRDVIEETLTIGGVLFRLIDTAGIREHTTDRIEQMGIEKSRTNAQKADIILLLQDPSDPDPDMDWLAPFASKLIPVLSKADQESTLSPSGTALALSAKTGQGLDALRSLLVQKATGGRLQEGTVVTNVRHQQALVRMLEHLQVVQEGLESGLSGDLLTVDIRQALYWLGTITGKVEIDRDVLGAIFSAFCIGK